LSKIDLKLELNDKNLEKIGIALSSGVRIKILNLLYKSCYCIAEIAEQLNIPVSTTAFHIKILKEAGLILLSSKPSGKGNIKLVSRCVDKVIVDLIGSNSIEQGLKTCSMSIPIGSYFDADVSPTCGMASEQSIIISDDLPSAFFSDERLNAQIIWFSKGYVEYRIPNYLFKEKDLCNINISMEICSEAPNYQNDWKSDITFWINEKEICTYQSEGDYGKHRGRLNPNWWSDYSSQYGLLINITVNKECVYLNELPARGVKLSQLNLTDGNYFTFRLGNKPNAKSVGGVNLFGEKFGDYAQNILFKFDYKEKL